MLHLWTQLQGVVTTADCFFAGSAFLFILGLVAYWRSRRLERRQFRIAIFGTSGGGKTSYYAMLMARIRKIQVPPEYEDKRALNNREADADEDTQTWLLRDLDDATTRFYEANYENRLESEKKFPEKTRAGEATELRLELTHRFSREVFQLRGYDIAGEVYHDLATGHADERAQEYKNARNEDVKQKGLVLERLLAYCRDADGFIFLLDGDALLKGGAARAIETRDLRSIVEKVIVRDVRRPAAIGFQKADCYMEEIWKHENLRRFAREHLSEVYQLLLDTFRPVRFYAVSAVGNVRPNRSQPQEKPIPYVELPPPPETHLLEPFFQIVAHLRGKRKFWRWAKRLLCGAALLVLGLGAYFFFQDNPTPSAEAKHASAGMCRREAVTYSLPLCEKAAAGSRGGKCDGNVACDHLSSSRLSKRPRTSGLQPGAIQ